MIFIFTKYVIKYNSDHYENNHYWAVQFNLVDQP